VTDESREPARSDKPFPSSLCHRCAAPPRYVRSDKGSIFVHCPVLKRYPPQPVTSCDAFTPRVD
jgi:hypothetical protein